MNLSQATPDDLDSITDVMISAYPVDPQWDYCFPRRREFPEDNWKHTRSMMADLLQRDHFVVNVVTDGEKGGIIARKVVSVAVWELLLEKDSRQYEDSPVWQRGGRRDASRKHMKAFHKVTEAAANKYFNAVYGDKQIRLWILGTRPDYQKHGIGTKQCIWGVRYAKAHSVPVTVLSSPLGGKICRSLGFRVITYVNVQILGERKSFCVGVMVQDHIRPTLRYS